MRGTKAHIQGIKNQYIYIININYNIKFDIVIVEMYLNQIYLAYSL